MKALKILFIQFALMALLAGCAKEPAAFFNVDITNPFKAGIPIEMIN